MNAKGFYATLLLVSVLLVASSCHKSPTPPTLVPANLPLGIKNVLPASMDDVYIENFNRYTRVITPNEGIIHIVAQSNITDEQIVRCRSVLRHYLADYKGSLYGDNKSAVANTMADNNSILCLLNGTDGDNPIGEKVGGQPLYENEIQVEGGSWYMDQDYDHRDATFEEILHLVHDNGIGIDGKGGRTGALPEFQAKIRLAEQNALANNIWGMGEPDWITDLTKENSLTQEYLASVIDAYYGLWGAWTESNTHSMWGLYLPKVRSEIASEDPMGNNLVPMFFQPYLTYNARICASLDGNFSLKYDASKPYTNASRYLKNVTLLGSNNNTVTVNELNNDITGNKGSNTVIFSGKKSEYNIVTANGETKVTDTLPDRDGVNTLRLIDKLQFVDQTVEI